MELRMVTISSGLFRYSWIQILTRLVLRRVPMAGTSPSQPALAAMFKSQKVKPQIETTPAAQTPPYQGGRHVAIYKNSPRDRHQPSANYLKALILQFKTREDSLRAAVTLRIPCASSRKRHHLKSLHQAGRRRSRLRRQVRPQLQTNSSCKKPPDRRRASGLEEAPRTTEHQRLGQHPRNSLLESTHQRTLLGSSIPHQPPLLIRMLSVSKTTDHLLLVHVLHHQQKCL